MPGSCPLNQSKFRHMQSRTVEDPPVSIVTPPVWRRQTWGRVFTSPAWPLLSRGLGSVLAKAAHVEFVLNSRPFYRTTDRGTAGEGPRMLPRLMPVEPQTQSHSLTLTTFQKLLHSPPHTGNPAWGLSAGEMISLPFHLPPQGWAWSRGLAPGHLSVRHLSDSMSSSLPNSPGQELCRRLSLRSPECGEPEITGARASSPPLGPTGRPVVAFTGGNSLLA